MGALGRLKTVEGRYVIVREWGPQPRQDALGFVFSEFAGKCEDAFQTGGEGEAMKPKPHSLPRPYYLLSIRGTLPELLDLSS